MMREIKKVVLSVAVLLTSLTAVTAASGATAPLSPPTNVKVVVGMGTATVSWGPSFPAAKVSYYLVMAMPDPLNVGDGKYIRSVKVKALKTTLTGLVKGGVYTFAVAASGKNSITTYSSAVRKGPFRIGGGASSSGPSAVSLQRCALGLGNWVIDTSNFISAQSGGLPPVITTFGESSPIEAWIMGQVGIFLSATVSSGQSAADNALLARGSAECSHLAKGGVNLAAIPAPVAG